MPLKLFLAALAALILAAGAQAQVGKSRNSETGTERQTRQAESRESKGTAGASRKISANAAILAAYVELFETNHFAQFAALPATRAALAGIAAGEHRDWRDAYSAAYGRCDTAQRGHYHNQAADLRRTCRHRDLALCDHLSEFAAREAQERPLIDAKIVQTCEREVGPPFPTTEQLLRWISANQPAALPTALQDEMRIVGYLDTARIEQVILAPQQSIPVTGPGSNCNPILLSDARDFNNRCLVPRRLSESDELTHKYLRAIAFAHVVAAQAADRLALAPVRDISTAAREAITTTDLARAAADADEIVARARCVGMYPRFSENEASLVLNCGAIQIDASQPKFLVLGRPTLSNETIAGRTVEVTLARDESQTASAEKSRSAYAKKSAATTKQWQQRPQ